MSVVINFVILCIVLPALVTCSVRNIPLEKQHNRPRIITTIADPEITDNSGYRLPTDLKPSHYNLTFTPFFSNGTFKGHANIMIDVINATNEIVLNCRLESIRGNSLQVVVQLSNQQYVALINITLDEEHQMVRFLLEEQLQPQTGVVIDIIYDGLLCTDMMGFYLSSYNTTDSSGVQTEHLMAITQFESTYARRAFPCFDEPAYRANFTINIYRAANQNSISNMKLLQSVTDTETDMVLDVYETSPVMPTYLVAFGVCDLQSKSDGGNIRVYTRQNVLQDAAFALSIGQPILDSTGNYTDLLYPLKKMDIVAVPDFSAGAMENWGLTTYREKYVLYNPKQNTKRDMFGVSSVMAHEFAHQWFGDLVTPEWWDYTWLNEAFATYFEYTTPNKLFPEWGIGSTLYIMEGVHEALNADVADTRPMTSPVYTPDQIENIFDYVIYEKGGSVLRMMEYFMTTPVWKDGLNRYLMKNAYGTGTPDELFSALEAAAYAANSSVAPRVTATLITWTTQPGYPLVTIHKEQGSYFLISQSAYETNNTNMRWSIPLTFTTQEKAQFDPSKADGMLMYTSSETVSINTTGWVIFNIEQIGYYRVNYEDDNWHKIIHQLTTDHTAIGTINRAQLIDDVFHLAQTGHVSYAIAFALTSYLPHETAYAPWKAFFNNMDFLINQFYNTPVGDGLMRYARDIMSSPFQSLTANLTASTATFLGSMVLQEAGQFSCDVHLQNCENLATTAFQSWMSNPYSIPPEVRKAVICTELRLDLSGKSFQTVLDYFLNSDNGAEKLSLLKAMGCTASEVAVKTYLDVVCDVNANHVRQQDRYIAIKELLNHQDAVTSVLQYVINHYEQVCQALGSRVNSVISCMGNVISQDTHIAQVQNAINNTKVDPRLRSQLETVVLPLVVARKSWTQTPQALELKDWVNNNINSSASSVVLLSLLSLTLSIFVTSQF